MLTRQIPRARRTGIYRVVEPGTTTVSLSEAKSILNVTTDVFDSLITSFLSVADGYIQSETNRSLIQQTRAVEYELGRVDRPLALIGPPVIEITKVETLYEGVTTEQTASDFYLVGRNSARPQAALKSSTTFAPDDMDGIRFTYTAGYGPAASDVPRELRAAAERVIVSLFDERDEYAQGAGSKPVSVNIATLIAPFIAPVFAS